MQLFSVVTGALLAILGGVVGQFLSYRLAKRQRREDIILEKAETLMKALYEHGTWMKQKKEKLLFRQETHDDLSPLPEAQMLQSLYFPSTRKNMLEIMRSEIKITKIIYAQHSEQTQDLSQWLESYDLKPFEEAYEEYLKNFSRYEREMREVIGRSIGS